MPAGKQTKRILAIVSLSLLALAPVLALAAGLVPCGGEGEGPCKIEDAFIGVARVTNWLLRVAGLYAVYKIVSFGWNLIISQGDEEKITTNKNGITNAVLGFSLCVIAFMLVSSIVNLILLQGIKECKIDWSRPLAYLDIDDSKCKGR